MVSPSLRKGFPWSRPNAHGANGHRGTDGNGGGSDAAGRATAETPGSAEAARDTAKRLTAPGADGRGAYLGHFIRTLSGVPGGEPLRQDPVRVAADACVSSGMDVQEAGSPSGRSWGGLRGEAEAEAPFLRCSYLHC